MGPAGRGRERRRRGRQRRHGRGRQGGARRLHAAGRLRGLAGDQPEPVRQPVLRLGQGLPDRRHLRAGSLLRDQRSQAAREGPEGVAGTRQGAGGSDQLRQLRHRLGQSPGRRDDQGWRRRADGARAVPRRLRGDRQHHRRPRPGRRRLRALGGGAGAWRLGPRARGVERQAHRADARRADGGGGRLRRLRRQSLVGLPGAGRPQGARRQAQRRRRRNPARARDQGVPGRAGRRGLHQHAGGIRRSCRATSPCGARPSPTPASRSSEAGAGVIPQTSRKRMVIPGRTP